MFPLARQLWGQVSGRGNGSTCFFYRKNSRCCQAMPISDIQVDLAVLRVMAHGVVIKISILGTKNVSLGFTFKST